jgi:hypothetical protein
MLDSIVESMRAASVQPAAVATPAVAAVAAPVAVVAGDDPTGKVCVCGHVHSRAVRVADRDRLATETACRIKGCVNPSLAASPAVADVSPKTCHAA